MALEPESESVRVHEVSIPSSFRWLPAAVCVFAGSSLFGQAGPCAVPPLEITRGFTGGVDESRHRAEACLGNFLRGAEIGVELRVD